MAPRTRTLLNLSLSFFAGWLATYLVGWGMLAEAALSAGVTLVLFVILQVVLPRRR